MRAEPAALLDITQRLPASWRQALKNARAELKARYQTNQDAHELLHEHCRLVDSMLAEVWRAADLPSSHALIAVGGYGRGEVFPHSDIDLLVLHPEAQTDGEARKIEQLIGTFWDIGLEAGHSVRSVADCVAQSQTDLTVETTLREARLVAGNRGEFGRLRAALAATYDIKRFFASKLEEQRKRHQRYNDTAYNLEPNLKEGPGGLRDLQNVLWIAHSAGQGTSWPGLAKVDLITTAEARQIALHELFLKDLRIRLHYLAGRRQDQLLFDYQAALAEELRLAGKGNKLPSEMLMQRYYRTAKAVSFLNTILLENLSGRIHPLAALAPVPENADFQMRGDVLRANDGLFERKPEAILDTFLLLQRYPHLRGLSPTTLRGLWRAKNQIKSAFRGDPANQARFMQILREPRRVTDVLRRMNQYGILGSYLPAFGRIVGQMQHDLFHVYTVDEHILRVVRNLRRFVVPDFAHEFPFCSMLAADFQRMEVLYVAALFHDIAKGRGGDHSRLGAVDARRFCKQHGLAKDDAALVAWLVEHHLEMSATAQKQDLSDPDVIARFARKVRDLRRLTALYLLTVADVRGTSPKVWNAWKGKLLEDLYRLTKRHLEGTSESMAAEIATKQADALKIIRQYALTDGVEHALWKNLDESYFRRYDASEIAWHTRAIRGRVATDQPMVRARLSPVGEGVQVMLYAPDREALFARICGVFDRMNYSVAEAKIYTTVHGYALDSFQLFDNTRQPAHYRDLLNYIEFELKERLASDAPLAPPVRARISRQLKHFPMTPQIELKPGQTSGYYVLSVVTGDRQGLLYAIAYVFVQHAITLHAARINTLGERAEDTFSISGAALADPERSAAFTHELMTQL